MKLYDCPFCGSEAEIHDTFDDFLNVSGVCVRCKNIACGVSTRSVPLGSDYLAKDKATEIWNRRVLDDALERKAKSFAEDCFIWASHGFQEPCRWHTADEPIALSVASNGVFLSKVVLVRTVDGIFTTAQKMKTESVCKWLDEKMKAIDITHWLNIPMIDD